MCCIHFVAIVQDFKMAGMTERERERERGRDREIEIGRERE